MQDFELNGEKSCLAAAQNDTGNHSTEQPNAIEHESLLAKQHLLYRLVNILNWDYLIDALGPYYVEANGCSGISIWGIVGLHYLKYLGNESDESVVERFCGFKIFQHQLPCHSTTLVNWRKMEDKIKAILAGCAWNLRKSLHYLV